MHLNSENWTWLLQTSFTQIVKGACIIRELFESEQDGTAAARRRFHAGSITAPLRQLPVTESSVMLPLDKGAQDDWLSTPTLSSMQNDNDARTDHARPLGL